jgi:hypothetical protein
MAFFGVEIERPLSRSPRGDGTISINNGSAED